MDTDTSLWHPGDSYAAVGGLQHCDGAPNPYIPSCPVVWLLPIVIKVTGQAFQCGLVLGYQQTIHGYDYGGGGSVDMRPCICISFPASKQGVFYPLS